MPDAVAQFGQALGLDYYTRHLLGYINDDQLPGYLGITTVHLGQIRSDPALIAKGDQILDFAAYQFPEFNNFNRWAARNSDSRDSTSYREALDSLWQGLDACAGTTVDRTDPDLKPYLGLLTSVGRKKACWWQGDLAPYSFEGYMLNLGNGLLKAGQVDQARIIFQNAHYAANYDIWPYRAGVGFHRELRSRSGRRSLRGQQSNQRSAPRSSQPRLFLSPRNRTGKMTVSGADAAECRFPEKTAPGTVSENAREL
jgi:hypothetical protein